MATVHCKFYQFGHCRYGDNGRYRHVKEICDEIMEENRKKWKRRKIDEEAKRKLEEEETTRLEREKFEREERLKKAKLRKEEFLAKLARKQEIVIVKEGRDINWIKQKQRQ